MGHARLVKADPKADYPSFLADVGEVETASTRADYPRDC